MPNQTETSNPKLKKKLVEKHKGYYRNIFKQKKALGNSLIAQEMYVSSKSPKKPDLTPPLWHFVLRAILLFIFFFPLSATK